MARGLLKTRSPYQGRMKKLQGDRASLESFQDKEDLKQDDDALGFAE